MVVMTQAEVERRITDGVASDTPSIYFNGFVTSTTSGDGLLVLERNSKPVATLNASFTVIKTLAAALTQLIDNIEANSGRPIMTTHEMDAFFVQANQVAEEPKKPAPRPSKKSVRDIN